MWLAQALIHEECVDDNIWFVYPDGKGFIVNDLIVGDAETAYDEAIEHTTKWLRKEHEE